MLIYAYYWTVDTHLNVMTGRTHMKSPGEIVSFSSFFSRRCVQGVRGGGGVLAIVVPQQGVRTISLTIWGVKWTR